MGLGLRNRITAFLIGGGVACLAAFSPAFAQWDGGPGSRPHAGQARGNRLSLMRGGGVIYPVTILQRSADQTITSGPWTAVSWDTTPVQDDVAAFASGSPTLVTVPPGIGHVRVTAYTVWNNNSTGQRFQRIDRTHAGATTTIKALVLPAAFESPETIVTRWMAVTPGDALSVLVIQSSGGNLGLAGVGDLFADPSDVQFEWAR